MITPDASRAFYEQRGLTLGEQDDLTTCPECGVELEADDPHDCPRIERGPDHWRDA